MERDLATIEKIIALTPIEGADKIEVATVLGWEVIVEKNSYSVGDLVVYCEYDTVLPVKPEFEFLRPRCYSKSYNGFRIRNMKLRGVYSQGIVFPLSILPSSVKIKEGLNVAKELGIRRYDPSELKEKEETKKAKGFKKFLFRFKFFRNLFLKKKDKSYPSHLEKSGETNIQKIFKDLKGKDTLFYKTEKLEGQSATYEYYKGKFNRYSHNVKLNKNSKGSWLRVEELYDIKNTLKEFYKQVNVYIALQGEIIGPGIQGNIYNKNEYEFYIFRIKDLSTGKYFEYSFLTLCINFLSSISGKDFKLVPVLGENEHLLGSVQELLDDSEKEKSKINPSVLREGVVWRSMTDQRIGFKVKSPKYDIWFNKKTETE